MVVYKGVKTVNKPGWTLEDYMDDYDKKLVALNKITEHHLEEAAKSHARERHIMLEYATMVMDIADSLWWEIGELRASLDNRESIFYAKDQKRRNELWSLWVNLNLEMNQLEKKHRELMERLYPY